MSAASIARALGGSKKTGRGFVCFCPAHDNRNTPALSIHDGDKGLVVHCFVGCDPLDVLAAIRAKVGNTGPVEAAPQPAKGSSAYERQQREKAKWLWRKRRPIEATIGETYLREHRGIRCALPRTLGFLPGNDRYPLAIIAAFGLAHEIEPGVIAITEHAVMSVHLIKLAPDGRKHRDEPNKISIASPSGAPIVLAPMNDLLGLAICEGVEDALSVHEATGLGAWAAGSAGMMPALADAVPDYASCVSIYADANKAGQENAAKLAERLTVRGIYAEIAPSAGAAS